MIVFSTLLNFRFIGNCTLAGQGRSNPISLIPWFKFETSSGFCCSYTRQVTQWCMSDIKVRPMPRHVWLDRYSCMCVRKIFRRFSTTEVMLLQDFQPSNLKHWTARYTSAPRWSCNRDPKWWVIVNSCPIMNKWLQMLLSQQRKVHQPLSITGCPRLIRHSLDSTILDYIHRWRVQGVLFCSSRWLNNFHPVSQLPIHRQHRRSRDYFLPPLCR